MSISIFEIAKPLSLKYCQNYKILLTQMQWNQWLLDEIKLKISLTQPLKFSLNRKKAGLFWIKFGFYRENDVERDCFQINVTGFLIVER